MWKKNPTTVGGRGFYLYCWHKVSLKLLTLIFFKCFCSSYSSYLFKTHTTYPPKKFRIPLELSTSTQNMHPSVQMWAMICIPKLSSYLKVFVNISHQKKTDIWIHLFSHGIDFPAKYMDTRILLVQLVKEISRRQKRIVTSTYASRLTSSVKTLNYKACIAHKQGWI